MKRKSWWVSLLLLCFWATAFGQHKDHTQDLLHDEHKFRHFRVVVLLGHTFIPAGHMDEYLLVPSWGLDLEYWFNDRWALALHNDLELEEFIIGTDERELLVRRYPLVATLDVLYRPWKGLVLQLGGGYEYEKEESFGLLRTGVEYEISIPGHWDLVPTFFYDSRFRANNTWSIALGVGKRF
jgi:hypothetical protein